MTQDYDNFDYPRMVDNAMRGVVREVLQQADRDGFSGQHHFYISFNTQHRGVSLSPQLREKYPSEMTIVLQHQFWDLDVKEHAFSLMLSFNNIPEKLVIPFDALTGFADPSVKFGLQFYDKAQDDEIEDMFSDDSDAEDDDAATADAEKASDGENVISIDAFRKK
jgi:uncharacterized protein